MANFNDIVILSALKDSQFRGKKKLNVERKIVCGGAIIGEKPSRNLHPNPDPNPVVKVRGGPEGLSPPASTWAPPAEI